MFNKLWHWYGWFRSFVMHSCHVMWHSKKSKFLQVPTCQICRKMENRQTFKKPPIFHSRVVSTILIRCWCPLGWLVMDNSLAFLQSKKLLHWESFFGIPFLSVFPLLLQASWAANKVRNGPVSTDQGVSTASQGSCHVHGTSSWNPPTSPIPPFLLAQIYLQTYCANW